MANEIRLFLSALLTQLLQSGNRFPQRRRTIVQNWKPTLWRAIRTAGGAGLMFCRGNERKRSNPLRDNYRTCDGPKRRRFMIRPHPQYRYPCNLRPTTGQTGMYTVPYLQAGTYSVSINKPGFQQEAIHGIVLGAAQIARGDAVLRVGAASATVEVQATGRQLRTESTSISQGVDSQVAESQFPISRKTRSISSHSRIMCKPEPRPTRARRSNPPVLESRDAPNFPHRRERRPGL